MEEDINQALRSTAKATGLGLAGYTILKAPPTENSILDFLKTGLGILCFIGAGIEASQAANSYTQAANRTWRKLEERRYPELPPGSFR